MDGVLERIDEDEEQKTDQSVLTDGDEAEGAEEMHSSGNKNENEVEGDDIEGDQDGDEQA